METNKQWRQVPFDYELAKKIQSGEVEGRIVTKDGESVRIICFDMDNEILKLVGIVRCKSTHREEYSVTYTSKGFRYDNIDSTKNPDLFIELPEKTSKHEFKAGDKVKIHLVGNRYDNWIATVVYKLRDSIGVTVNNYPFVYHSKHLELVESYEEKHEFRPFEQVLVRDNKTQEWVCTMLSHMKTDGDYPIYISICNYPWLECIPFAGNEHLVGTTDDPSN